ncbi:hypothetical protein, partial [Bacillus cereus group sp. TH254-2LC]|uniref:hypothetical protein n=1 Tax=Bacillus cereus group sp. TH254-2LC TaxID=3018042 RepID=UPI0022DFC571
DDGEETEERTRGSAHGRPGAASARGRRGGDDPVRPDAGSIGARGPEEEDADEGEEVSADGDEEGTGEGVDAERAPEPGTGFGEVGSEGGVIASKQHSRSAGV